MGTLRLVLALVVACAHLGAPGDVIGQYASFAVRVFFVISGFYMALILTERKAYARVRNFYVSRALKLLPLYWAVSLLAIVAYAAFVPASPANPLTRWSQTQVGTVPLEIAYSVISLTTLIGADTWMWLGFNPITGALSVAPDFEPGATTLLSYGFVPQAWTIGLEISFYAIAPFIVRRSLKLIVALIAVSLLCRGIVAGIGFSGAPWDRVLFPTEMIFFLLGAVSYRMLQFRARADSDHMEA
jgi:peptidoglycan/LPS O-acetylase OafA/YrhL